MFIWRQYWLLCIYTFEWMQDSDLVFPSGFWSSQIAWHTRRNGRICGANIWKFKSGICKQIWPVNIKQVSKHVYPLFRVLELVTWVVQLRCWCRFHLHFYILGEGDCFYNNKIYYEPSYLVSEAVEMNIKVLRQIQLDFSSILGLLSKWSVSRHGSGISWKKHVLPRPLYCWSVSLIDSLYVMGIHLFVGRHNCTCIFMSAISFFPYWFM